MRRKMLLTIFKYLFFFQRYLNFKICKLAKRWHHTLHQILINYDEKRYLSQFVCLFLCTPQYELIISVFSVKILAKQNSMVCAANWPRKFYLLCSTKWNASLIFACDSAELVALCKVMLWKTHIPVRTQKRPPRLIFAGACHGIVINYGHG